MADTPVCWICLLGGEETESGEQLEQPCQCTSRYVHKRCLARWQLQCAGREEEKKCRFCEKMLPDWRPTLTPQHLSGCPSAVPLVSIHFNGHVYKLRIKPGAEGREQFKQSLAKITGTSLLDNMQITFQCKSPDNLGQDLSLKGMTAFEAAIHCAAVSATERAVHKQLQKLHPRDAPSSDATSEGTASSASSPRAPGSSTRTQTAAAQREAGTIPGVNTRPLHTPWTPSTASSLPIQEPGVANVPSLWEQQRHQHQQRQVHQEEAPSRLQQVGALFRRWFSHQEAHALPSAA